MPLAAVRTGLRSRLARRSYRRPPPGVLSAAQRSFWDDKGYLILPGQFSRDQVDAVNRYVDELWTSRRTNLPIAVDIYLETNPRRPLLSKAPPDARAQPYKLSDLFLESELVREIALDPRLSAVLADLLEGQPLLINSLNLEYGSEQDFHTDNLFMAAPDGIHLVAAWIALEDVSADAGPLKYYPGSHRIPPYRFSSGDLVTLHDEMPGYREYMATQLESRNLAVEHFTPRAGDVLIWQSLLYHGGEPISDRSLTRRSVVTHYWRARDLPGIHAEVGPGRYYLKREPHPPFE